jgi:uncharacterized protein
MYFVVISRDKPGMGERRARVRPAHLEYMKQPRPGGRHIIGMPLSDDDGEAMTGSLYIMEAQDRASAELFARHDPYAEAGIFETTEVIGVHPAFAADVGRIGPKPE